MPLIFWVLSLFIWCGCILFFDFYFVSIIGTLLTALCCLLIFKQKGDPLPKSVFLSGKVILLFSFWSCVALSIQKTSDSILCMNCFESYLTSVNQPSLDGILHFSDLSSVYQAYPRLLTMILLLCLWAICFIFLNKRKVALKWISIG